MAEIDKALPNVKQTVNIPGPQEVELEQQERLKEQVDAGKPIDVQENEDGSVDINFDPSIGSVEQSGDHFANLAELLPDDVLDPLGSKLFTDYQDYKNSRRDWERAYTSGLDLLGFNYDDRSEPFKGASGASHPVLAEAVTQFQSLAYKELLPSTGPVRTQIVGMLSPDKEQQGIRVKEFMNYQIMNKMPEYEADFDQMLFYLPLAGSAFKKIYYDELMQRAVSKFVPADDLVVPYTASSLDECESIIHMIRMTENALRKQQVGGFYRDIELTPTHLIESELQEKERKLEGTTRGRDDRMFTILECHISLDLEGFEDQDAEGNPTGIKLPYIVTVEEGTRKILSIRRNYQAGDPMKKKIDYFECNSNYDLQIQARGSNTLRILSRLEFTDSMGPEESYRIRVREGAKVVGTYYFNTERSSVSQLLNKPEVVPGKWRSCEIPVNKGEHTYTIEIPDKGKTVLTRYIVYK